MVVIALSIVRWLSSDSPWWSLQGPWFVDAFIKQPGKWRSKRRGGAG